MMNDEELMLYSRHILLPQIGIEGQQKLRQSRVLILGLGGLGSPAALYLASSGIGHLILVDDDQVELSNLQRQIIHQRQNIGQAKVRSAQQHLQALNPDCQIEIIDRRLNEEQLWQLFQGCDAVLDCSDNFTTRFAVNRASYHSRTPLISAAAIRWEGQIAVFNYQPDSPCYRCLYDEQAYTDESCSNNGVAAPSVGAMGCLQANECLKLLTGAGEILDGRLLLCDLLYNQFRTLKIQVDPQCPVCHAAKSSHSDKI